jgi:hypothetical protein
MKESIETNNTTASSLFENVPKYAPLISYFEGVEINDLKKFTPEELKKNVESLDTV